MSWFDLKNYANEENIKPQNTSNLFKKYTMNMNIFDTNNCLSPPLVFLFCISWTFRPICQNYNWKMSAFSLFLTENVFLIGKLAQKHSSNCLSHLNFTWSCLQHFLLPLNILLTHSSVSLFPRTWLFPIAVKTIEGNCNHMQFPDFNLQKDLKSDNT